MSREPLEARRRRRAAAGFPKGAPFSRIKRRGRKMPAPPPFGVMSWDPKRMNRAARLRWRHQYDASERSAQRLLEQAEEASAAIAVKLRAQAEKFQNAAAAAGRKLARFFRRMG